MKNYDPKKPSKFITYLDMSDNDNDNDNEFISAYPFYMKLALRPKIIYTKKEILCNEILHICVLMYLYIHTTYIYIIYMQCM